MAVRGAAAAASTPTAKVRDGTMAQDDSLKVDRAVVYDRWRR
jgi:hypothetical protein